MLLRYGQSSLFEQTTPAMTELVDNNASVSGGGPSISDFGDSVVPSHLLYYSGTTL